MSCYVVGFDHIDALVTAAASVCHGRHDSGLTWYHTADGTEEMERHELSYSDRVMGTAVGQMLLTENVESVCYRYSDCEPGGDLPGTIGETNAEDYTYRPVNSYDLPPETQSVVILKAVRCYIYQACEHPGWSTSEAKSFCEALTVKMINQLPGYDEAKAWEFSRQSAARQ